MMYYWRCQCRSDTCMAKWSIYFLQIFLGSIQKFGFGLNSKSETMFYKITCIYLTFLCRLAPMEVLNKNLGSAYKGEVSVKLLDVLGQEITSSKIPQGKKMFIEVAAVANSKHKFKMTPPFIVMKQSLQVPSLLCPLCTDILFSFWRLDLFNHAGYCICVFQIDIFVSLQPYKMLVFCISTYNQCAK